MQVLEEIIRDDAAIHKSPEEPFQVEVLNVDDHSGVLEATEPFLVSRLPWRQHNTGAAERGMRHQRGEWGNFLRLLQVDLDLLDAHCQVLSSSDPGENLCRSTISDCVQCLIQRFAIDGDLNRHRAKFSLDPPLSSFPGLNTEIVDIISMTAQFLELFGRGI